MSGIEATSESDESLLERIRRGDEAAFDVLFDRYRRRVMAYALAIIGDRGLAEDVVQETFVELVRNAAWLEGRRGILPWLCAVARNRAIDILRHRRFETSVELAALRSVPDQTARTAGEELSRSERLRLLAANLRRLPRIEREILMLHFFGGLTFRETGQVLKRPLGTVLWLARRALERLRGMMPDD